MKFVISAAVVAGLASVALAGQRVEFADAPQTIANPVSINPSIFHGQQEALPYTAGGFEGFTVGALNGQNNWTVDVTPTRYTVGAANGVGGTKGVTAVGGSGATADWSYPGVDAAYTPGANQLVSINADIARSVGSAAASSSFGYFVDVYNSATVRTFRFGLGLNSTTNKPVVVVTTKWSSALGFNPTAPTANVIITTDLVAGTFYNLEARANYTAKTFDLYSNNTLIQGNMPFASLVAADFSDADLMVSTNTTLADSGSWDNYAINVISVPEPTTLAGLAGLSLFGARRRSR